MYFPKLSTGSPRSRSRGSPRVTMGRTLMAREYTDSPPEDIRPTQGGTAEAAAIRLTVRPPIARSVGRQAKHRLSGKPEQQFATGRVANPASLIPLLTR